MVNWPSDFDTDATIPRVDNNITEIGDSVINSIREAIFNLQDELGLNPSGSAGSVVNFLLTSHNADGTIKASALTSVGLATLPIVDNQVASNAGIKESKLALDHGTSDLHTLITANSTLLNSVSAFSTTTNSDLLTHIAGGNLLSDGSTAGRHVASHIDINSIPSDSRDSAFTWSGLIDKDGNQRSAGNVAKALEEINDALVTHENSTDTTIHPATAVSINTDDFTELPTTLSNVQEALDAIDDTDRLQIGVHRAIQHSNGIPPTARSQSFINPDGYNSSVVPSTKAFAYLTRVPATTPQDNQTTGDDIVKFIPDNSNFLFDSQFSAVKPGDIIRVNYGGFESSYSVDEKRHTPGSEWIVRLNGVNLANADGYIDGYAFARIDRPLFDDNTFGVLSVAPANNDIDPSIQSSVIVGHPRAATVLGLDFDPNQIDSSHYNLYLQLYPTGNPSDKIITLPAIDVTGNQGASPGQYTLDTLINTTNRAFRAAGYNYRFIAFGHNGQFGVQLADSISGAAFSIVSGELSGSTLIEGSFTNNVIGDALDGLDALGFGAAKANVASPQYAASFTSSISALTPTKVISPFKKRSYIVNGVRRDDFAATPLTTDDGYWDATITNKTTIGSTTVETEYTINIDLSSAGLEIGKTLTVQPTISFSDASYSDNDYGRFFIKAVSFNRACPTDPIDKTIITVVNSVHSDGSPIGFTSSIGLDVRIHFGEDSVSFNSLNLINGVSTGIDYNRLHELFVDENGNTFTHERARMPKQSGSATLLETNSRWNIRDISPKLNGFPDSGSNNLRSYIRFFVLSYSSTTGEYDGYIGNPSGLSIEDFGKVVTGRKNIPTRFYDSSNIDYIDIEFYDESTSPGADIMSSNLPRYVDIEIFPGLSNNDEYMRIATCELDNDRVDRVVDRREFGSIGEKDITDSLIKFITASDKFIHENGVLRGLDFISVSSSDDRIINFQGGFALVNGEVVPVNDGSVAIPEIWKSSTSKPTTVDWAVCVNKDGNFQPIVLTSSKDQFFATSDGVTSYYVPSVTFAELVNKRKDLTLIATVTASISSISLSVTDARRFITNTGMNSSLVLTEDGGERQFMFDSVAAMGEWITGTGMNQVIVSGNITIDSAAASSWPGTSTPHKDIYFVGEKSAQITVEDSVSFNLGSTHFSGVNFTIGTSSTLITDGNIRDCEISIDEGGKIRLNGYNVLEDISVEATSLGCIQLSNVDNVVLRRVNFDYDPPDALLPSFTTDDHINANHDLGIVYSIGENIDGLVIEDCKFESNIDTGSQRPPLILLKVDNGDVLNNIRIRNNYFEDQTETARQAAIAIVSTNALDGSNSGAILINSEISFNKCNEEQGIYIVGSRNNSNTIDNPGLHILNTAVSNNICGVVGYNISSDSQVNYDNADVSVSVSTANLIIKENVVKLIMLSNEIGTDHEDLGLVSNPAGTVHIINNKCNWIKALVSGGFNGVRGFINGNALNPDDTTFLEDYIQSGNTPDGYGIHVFSSLGGGSNQGIICEISNNTLHSIIYNHAIHVDRANSTFINNNYIGAINSGGVSIFTNCYDNIITNNIIERNANILAFVKTGSDCNNIIVTENRFNNTTIDGSDTTLVNTSDSTSASTVIVERNVNQTVTREISAGSAYLAVEDTSAAISSFVSAGGPSSLSNNYIGTQFFPANPATTTRLLLVAYDGGTGEKRFVIHYDLSNILPANVRVVSASVLYDSTGTFDTNGDVTLLLASDNTSGADSGTVSDTGDLNVVDTDTLTVTPSSIEEFTTVKDVVLLRLDFNLNTTNDTEISINPLQISYRW